MSTRHPPLTKKVLAGLAVLAGVVEAGTSADILGYEEDKLAPEELADWENILKACEWIRNMQKAKGE